MKSQKARPKPERKKAGKARSGSRKHETGNLTERRNLQIAVLALVALVVICYANSIGNAFVFDDLQVVLIDGRPTSLSHLMRMLTSSYRPIRNLSYALDFGIWGASPFGFHLTNIIIHAANTVLVFWLVRRISSNRGYFPFLAAAIFAVHPIQTDAVTYISGRRDILFSLFYIASFHAYLSFRKSR